MKKGCEENYLTVEGYIEKSKPFAHKILKHLRYLVHQANPNMEETLKWGFPHFTYKGIVCSMAAFKEHCAFTFWKENFYWIRGIFWIKNGLKEWVIWGV